MQHLHRTVYTPDKKKKVCNYLEASKAKSRADAMMEKLVVQIASRPETDAVMVIEDGTKRQIVDFAAAIQFVQQALSSTKRRWYFKEESKMEKLFALEAIQKGRDFGEVFQMWRESWETAKKTVEKMESDPAEVFADTLALVAYSTYLMGVQDGMGLDLNPTSQQMQEFYSNIVQ